MGFAVATDLRPQPHDAVGHYLRYKLEHMELFGTRELPWPCPREVCQVINEYTMGCRGLTLRQLEAVAFLHQAFPPPAGFHGAEFVDVNMSLGFMLSYKRGDAALTSESPWCPEPKTIVSGRPRQQASAASRPVRVFANGRLG